VNWDAVLLDLGHQTMQFLAELDRITVEAGGAVNPYKDARMSPATFEASFPWWRELLPFRTCGSRRVSGGG